MRPTRFAFATAPIAVSAITALTPLTATAAAQTPGDAGAPRSAAPSGARVVRVYSRDDPEPGTDSLTPGEEKKLFRSAYPVFLPEGAPCKDIDGDIDAQRAAGNFAPRVRRRMSGAFTAAGLEETLYVVARNECGASHADNWGTTELLVLRDDRIVARADAYGGSWVTHVIDVDGDGRAEVVLAFYYAQVGIAQVTARLVDIGPTGITVVKDLDGVGGSNCGSLEKKKGQWDVVIEAVARPGRPLAFTSRRKSAACIDEH